MRLGIARRLPRQTVLSVAAGLIIASASATARPPYRKPVVRVEVEQTALTRIFKKTPAAKTKRERRRVLAPKISGEAFRTRMKAKSQKLTDAAVKALNGCSISPRKDDRRKADFYFRLAEYCRDKKVHYDFEARGIEEKISLEKDPSRRAALKRRQAAYEKYEKQWMLCAIKLYLKIATRPRYAKYKRMDEVLFNVAALLKEAKRHAKARIFFRKLIRNYPQSRFVPEIYLSFAEFYFNNNEVAKALKLYQRVERYPDSAIYGYAIYKQGWCWLNLKDPRKALEMFVRIIKNAKRWAGTRKSKILLVKESKKDAVKAYASVGTPDKAWHFFQRIGGSDARAMLEGLANLYYDQGKFSNATIEGWKKQGGGYAKLASAHPDGKRWGELVYNAAMDFEAAKLLGRAISIRKALVAMKLHDKADKEGRILARKALYQLGGNFQALAWYSRAADYYEQFAKAFPGERDAPDALQNAIIFRLGCAEYQKAKDDVALFVKHYGTRRKYKARAASAVFSLGVIYDERKDRDAIVKFYQRYLKKWGAAGGEDRQILANVRIARALWERSCPVKGVHGVCITQERVRLRQWNKMCRRQRRKRWTTEFWRQCGPAMKTKITVHKRKAGDARRAMRRFAEVLRLSRHVKVKGATKEERARRLATMRFAVAEALFFTADRLFERFLEVKFPKGLDFSKSKRERWRATESAKRFVKYLAEKSKLLTQARAAYQNVIKLNVVHWAIAGVARIGQLYQRFADALYTAPVPRPPIPKALRRREDIDAFIMTFTDAYSDTLGEKARPLEKKAVQVLSVCLKKSTQVSLYNAWSRLCERELNQIKPDEYPMTTEIRSKPGYIDLRPAQSGVVTHLE